MGLALAFVNLLWLGLITLGINIINRPTSPSQLFALTRADGW